MPFGLCNRLLYHVPDWQIIGTLRSNDADGNENVKKTTSRVHHAFWYIYFLFLQDYDVKMPNLAFYGRRKQATTKFFFLFLSLDMVP